MQWLWLCPAEGRVPGGMSFDEVSLGVGGEVACSMSSPLWRVSECGMKRCRADTVEWDPESESGSSDSEEKALPTELSQRPIFSSLVWVRFRQQCYIATISALFRKIQNKTRKAESRYQFIYCLFITGCCCYLLPIPRPGHAIFFSRFALRSIFFHGSILLYHSFSWLIALYKTVVHSTPPHVAMVGACHQLKYFMYWYYLANIENTPYKQWFPLGTCYFFPGSLIARPLLFFMDGRR